MTSSRFESASLATVASETPFAARSSAADPASLRNGTTTFGTRNRVPTRPLRKTTDIAAVSTRTIARHSCRSYCRRGASAYARKTTPPARA
jgi:hypothetical protein